MEKKDTKTAFSLIDMTGANPAEQHLQGKNFVIQLYQRGYRWEKRQVLELLQDILEFASTETEGFYCLQPLVVNNASGGNSYNVLDGQQRLTTIYLIYSYFKQIGLAEPPFTLTYIPESDVRSECLKKLPDITDEQREKNIDCYYIAQAYDCICNFFESHSKNEDNFCKEFKKILDTKVKMIWHNVNLSGGNSSEEKEFSKINQGTIRLASAELIKAFFLATSTNPNEELRRRIAAQWAQIEQELSDEKFFRFLTKRNYVNRMDFLFDLKAHQLNEQKKFKRVANLHDFSFHVFSDYIQLQKQTDPQQAFENIWQEMLEFFDIFKRWYTNLHTYHLVGFLLYTARYETKTLLELSECFRSCQTLSDFESKLQSKIKTAKDIFTYKDPDNQPVSLENNLTELLGEESDKPGLTHSEHNEDLRRLLLLYNLAYLDCCNSTERFRFDLFKSYSWDLEDINSQNPAPPPFSDKEPDNPQKMWLEALINNPYLLPNKDWRDNIEQILHDKDYLTGKSNKLFDVKDVNSLYNQVLNGKAIQGIAPAASAQADGEWKNKIGNLTLLDSHTNRSYQNAIFPVKRHIILSSIQNGTFILPCTRRVFTKELKGTKNLFSWNTEDASAYKKDMAQLIKQYLNMDK